MARVVFVSTAKRSTPQEMEIDCSSLLASISRTWRQSVNPCTICWSPFRSPACPMPSRPEAGVPRLDESPQAPSAVLEQLIERDALLVVGAEYSLETGVVDFFDGVA